MQYFILGIDGSNTPFIPKGERPSLEEMQKIVEGYIERVSISGGELWVNEEGVLNNLPINWQASLLAKQKIVGQVLYRG